ncbi:DUF6584 family protein [Kitasatospora sp. NPDC057198]|uniref:DUF6584 family protein n=1 Tax=Kitasatospora sp. NPDC057198 TaxID=3346046 RepID=UPI00363B9CE8
MSVESTLAKVEADLREGRGGRARLRLLGLISSYPTDLAIRHRLADAYQRVSWAEEGRWDFLDEALHPIALAAFEERHPAPAHRLELLRWPDPAHNPPATPLARRRLAALHHRATGTAPDWPDHPEDAATTETPAPTLPPPPPAPPRYMPPGSGPEPSAAVVAFDLTMALIVVVIGLMGLLSLLA